MRAEVVAIGSELLLGQNVDTNSAWISGRLAEIGVDVHRHTTVGDNPARMREVLAEAALRAEVVLVTGGLGPTQDDVTRYVVADLAGVELVPNPELVTWIEGIFARGGREMPASNLVQAELPAGARVLAPSGTAAGFAVDVEGAGAPTTIICMPGVPRELHEMMDRQVVPDLVERAGLATTVSRLVRTAGMSESRVAEAAGPLVNRLEEGGNPTIAFLASGGETKVRVTAKAASRPEALALLEPVVAELVELLGTGVAGVDDEGPEHAVARLLSARGWTLGVMESVTGGGVGARLVQVPGASAWFRGGVVAYDADVKVSLAGVDAELIASDGPVSEAAAGALAEAALDRLGADVGLGVVGVAGPTTQNGRDVGTVCLGVMVPTTGLSTWSRVLPSRERVETQVFSVSAAIDYLRRALLRA